jgi:hypothetical protein
MEKWEGERERENERKERRGGGSKKKRREKTREKSILLLRNWGINHLSSSPMVFFFLLNVRREAGAGLAREGEKSRRNRN